MWMSSSSNFSGTPSRSYSAAMRSRPSRIAAASSAGIIPWSRSIAACAFDAAISSRHSRLSKPIDALIRSISSEADARKRPPHIFCFGASSDIQPALLAGVLRVHDGRLNSGRARTDARLSDQHGRSRLDYRAHPGDEFGGEVHLLDP